MKEKLGISVSEELELVEAESEAAFSGTENMNWMVFEGETGAIGFSTEYEEACRIALAFAEALKSARELSGQTVDGECLGFRIMETKAFVSIRDGEGKITELEKK